MRLRGQPCGTPAPRPRQRRRAPAARAEPVAKPPARAWPGMRAKADQGALTLCAKQDDQKSSGDYSYEGTPPTILPYPFLVYLLPSTLHRCSYLHRPFLTMALPMMRIAIKSSPSPPPPNHPPLCQDFCFQITTAPPTAYTFTGDEDSGWVEIGCEMMHVRRVPNVEFRDLI